MAVLLALLLPIARIGVDAHHDGAMIKPALDVLAGQVMFRDTFMQYGVLSCGIEAFVLWLHPSVLAVRLLAVACYGAALLGLYAVWRLLLPRSLAMVAGLAFILFIPVYEKDPWLHEYWPLLAWSSLFALVLQCVVLHALCRVIRGEQPARWGGLLGAACAAIFWCRQPVGMLMTAGVAVIWPALLGTGWVPAGATKRAILGRILAGFLLVNAVLLGGLAAIGVLPEWWEQNFAWPARWSQGKVWGETLVLFVQPAMAAGILAVALALAVPGRWRRFRPDLPPGYSVGWFVLLGAFLLWQHVWLWQVLTVNAGGWNAVLPLVIGALTVEAGWRALAGGKTQRPVEYHLVSAVTVVALASLPQYYPTADPWHIFYALAPGFGLCAYAVWRWSGATPARVALVLLLALVPTAWEKARVMGPALDRPLVTLDRPTLLRGMRVPPEQAEVFNRISDTVALVLRHEPDLPAAMIGNDALYLCFARNRANPTPYYVTWKDLAGPADNARRWAWIAQVRPMLMLQRARWAAVNDFYREQNYVPILYVHEQAFELAVPRELAERMGLKAYGAPQNSPASPGRP